MNGWGCELLSHVVFLFPRFTEGLDRGRGRQIFLEILTVHSYEGIDIEDLSIFIQLLCLF